MQFRRFEVGEIAIEIGPDKVKTPNLQCESVEGDSWLICSKQSLRYRDGKPLMGKELTVITERRCNPAACSR